MKKLKILVLALTLGLVSTCTNEDSTRETLRKAGFTEVEVGGYDWFGCSDDDTFQTKFKARNPRGDMVNGTVCCGLIFKNCTIRF